MLPDMPNSARNGRFLASSYEPFPIFRQDAVVQTPVAGIIMRNCDALQGEASRKNPLPNGSHARWDVDGDKGMTVRETEISDALEAVGKKDLSQCPTILESIAVESGHPIRQYGLVSMDVLSVLCNHIRRSRLWLIVLQI